MENKRNQWAAWAEQYAETVRRRERKNLLSVAKEIDKLELSHFWDKKVIAELQARVPTMCPVCEGAMEIYDCIPCPNCDGEGWTWKRKEALDD